MTRGRHLRFQVLGALTLAIGALPWSFAASLGDPVQLAGAYFSWAAALYLYAAGGAAGAALTLSPGDAMRPGWTFLATSYVVLIPAGLWYGPRGLGLYESTNRSPAVLVTAGLASGAMAVTAFLFYLVARRFEQPGEARAEAPA